MAKSKWYSVKKGLSFFLALTLFIGLFNLNTSPSVAMNLADTGWKSATPMNGQFDYRNDQQTAVNSEVSQDLVGDDTRPVLQTKYDSTAGEIGFRIRINNRDGLNDTQPAYKNFAFVGVDAANAAGQFDGGIDFIVGIYNVTYAPNNRGTIGIYNTGPDGNFSPSTTTIINPALIEYNTTKQVNFSLDEVSSSSYFGSKPDYFLSYKVKISDINLAMMKAGKTTRVTASTPLKFMVGTSSQDNAFNQDVGGLQGLNTKSTQTWAELGAFSQTTSFDGQGPTVNFYRNENNSGTGFYTSVTAISGYALGVLPTIAPTGSAYFIGWSTTTAGPVDFTSTTAVTSDLNLYAQWTSSAHTVTFKYDDETTSDKTVLVGSGSPIGRQFPETPTRTGYTFLGWKDINGNIVSANTIITSDTTFTAIWAQLLTLSFVVNGGKFIINDTERNLDSIDTNIVSGSSLGGFPEVSGESQNPDWYLVGWFDNSSGTGTPYTASTVITTNTSLYASWTSIAYTLIFDPNMPGLVAPSPVSIAAGGTIGHLPILTTASALFEGWQTQSGVAVTEGSIITSNTTLVGIWSPFIQVDYIVDSSLYVTQTAVSGHAIGAFPEDPPTTSVSAFDGWYTIDGTKVTTGSIFPGPGPVTLYATSNPGIKIAFDSNDGSSGLQIVAGVSGNPLSTVIPSPDPTRTNYTFRYWSNTSNGTAITSSDAISIPATYYAIWASNVKFLDGVITTTAAIISGSSIGAVNMPPDPTSPTPSAYTFSHWGICPDGTTVITEGTIVTDPVTVCAIYKAIVNFDYNGSGTPTVSKSALSGAALGTDFPTTPIRTGYIFSGWSSSPTTLVSPPFTSQTAVTVPVTYYAIWTADSAVQTNNTGGGGGGGALPPVVQFTITYDSNGGTTAANPAKQTVESGGTVGTLPTPPTKAGNAFAGWNTLIDGSGLKFLATTIVKASMTVFAQWLPQVTKVIEGVVTDKETGGPLPGVVVILRGPDGKEIGRTTTDDQGRYQIPNVPPGTYNVTMSKEPYGVLELPVTVPSDGGSNVPVNGALDKYRITLTAYPDTIIGDGINETILAAKVVDQNGQPLGGVLVTFTAPLGTFPNGPMAWTDNTGLATIPYRSSDLSSSTTPQRIPVTAQVNDPARGLNAQAIVYVIFTPYDKDLAIVLKADQMKVQEGASAGFVINYVNKSVSAVEDVFLKVNVPDTMEFEAASMNGTYANGEITWNVGTMGRNVSKQLSFVLRTKQLTQSQQYTTLQARIGTNQKITLNNLQDDQSSLRVLLFSNRYDQAHTLYIKGYPDGLVKPERTVTRAEVAAMFTRLLGWSNDPAKKSGYSDVVSWEWYNDYVEAVIEHGLFKGYENNTFQPDKPITRAELATAIARQLAISKEQRTGYLFKLSPFGDTVNHWAEGTLEELYRYQVVSGDGSGFRPDQPISRQETVKMMNRLFYRGTLQGTMPAYPDNLPSNWSYYEMEEAVRTHSFQYQPDGTETYRQ